MIYTKHVLQYIEYRINDIQIKSDKSRALFDEYAAEQNAKWYNKLFGWKYTGHPDYWDFQMLNGIIYKYKDIQRKAVYNDKMGYETMSIPEDFETGFYRWAESNNIPY